MPPHPHDLCQLLLYFFYQDFLHSVFLIEVILLQELLWVNLYFVQIGLEVFESHRLHVTFLASLLGKGAPESLGNVKIEI